MPRAPHKPHRKPLSSAPHLAQEPRQTHRGTVTHNRDEGATWLEDLLRIVPVLAPPDAVVHDVEVMAREQLSPVLLTVVHDGVRSQSTDQRGVTRAAGGCHRCAQCLGQLHGEGAWRSTRSVRPGTSCGDVDGHDAKHTEQREQTDAPVPPDAPRTMTFDPFVTCPRSTSAWYPVWPTSGRLAASSNDKLRGLGAMILSGTATNLKQGCRQQTYVRLVVGAGKALGNTMLHLLGERSALHEVREGIHLVANGHRRDA